MSEGFWLFSGLVIVMLLCFLGRRWQRRQRAGRLADVLLAEVLKTKDSFRR
jgi:hypothetical protein